MAALKRLYKKLVNRETVMYLIFGVLTTALGFGLYAAFIFLGLGVFWANTLSTAAAVIFAFFTNKLWVFRALNMSAGNMAKEFAKFCAGRLAVYVIDTALLVVLVDVLMFDPILSRAFTMVFVVVANYFASKLIVFK